MRTNRGQRGQHFFHQRGARAQQEYRDRQQRANQQQEGPAGLAGLFQILPIIVVILMSLSSFGTNNSNYGPQYSLHQTSVNVHPIKTAENPYVMPGTPFYISTDLRHKKKQGRIHPRDWQQIEQDVSKQFFETLKSDCHREKQRNMRFSDKKSHKHDKCEKFGEHRRAKKTWEEDSEFGRAS